MRDLQDDLGFRLGPWNQAYMFDTLPVTLTKRQMRPGDLVFMTGEYTNPKKKKQRHNMLHVEIWLGEGDKTIGSRWNNGKVSAFDSYKFDPKSFHNEQYIFKSIDTWLMGICHSYCSKHPWRLRKVNPSAKSIFNVEDAVQDEKASPDSDDEAAEKDNQKGRQSVLQEDGEESEGQGGGGGGGGLDSSLAVEDVALELVPASGDATPNSATSGHHKAEASSRTRGVRMPSPRKFKASLKNRIHALGSGVKCNNSGKESAKGDRLQRQKGQTSHSSAVSPPRPSQSRGNATVTMDHDATVLSQSADLTTRFNSGRKTDTSVGDLSLLRAAANRRITATIVTSVRTSHEDAVVTHEGDLASSSVLREVTEEEIDYIPNRLPSRSGPRVTNAWRTSKDREVRPGRKVTPVEHSSQRNGARKDDKTVYGNPNENRVKFLDSPLSVVGSHDNLVHQAVQCPNTGLQSSETNLLFRTNTNFFKSGVNTWAASSQWPAGRCNQGETEKVKWRLASRISPEPGCEQSKVSLNLDLVKEKLKDINLIDDTDDFSDLDSVEGDQKLGGKDDITKCLIIKQSPRVQPPQARTPCAVLPAKSRPGRGRGRGGGRQAKGNAFKRAGQSRVDASTDIVSSGRNAPVFLSTCVLQSALCLTPEDEADERLPVGTKRQPCPMPPVDDDSVLVRAGTASQLSSRPGFRGDEMEKHHRVKHDSGSVTFGVSGNRQDGQWNNSSATPRTTLKSSKNKTTKAEQGYQSTTSCKNNNTMRQESDCREAQEVHAVNTASLEAPVVHKMNSASLEAPVVHTMNSASLESKDAKNLKESNCEAKHVKTSVVTNSTEQTTTIPKSILKVFPLEESDDGDVADTSFSSDLSFDQSFSTETLGLITSDYKKADASGDCSQQNAVRTKESSDRGNVAGGRVSDIGDWIAPEDKSVFHHENEYKTISRHDHLDVDTDDEIESGLSLTSLHNYSCSHHRKFSVVNVEKDSTNINHRLAVLGSLCGALPGNQRTNPAWEWLYSFPHGCGLVNVAGHVQGEVLSEGNANNNSNAVDERCEGGTSLYVRAGDDPFTTFMEVKEKGMNCLSYGRPLSSRLKTLPPLQSRVPSGGTSRKRYSLTDQQHHETLTEARLLTEDQSLMNELDGFVAHYNHSNLLASYVLTQQPRGVDGPDCHEVDDASRLSHCRAGRDTYDYNNDMQTDKNIKSGTPFSDSGADSYSGISDERQTLTSSLSTLDDASCSRPGQPRSSYFEKLRRQDELRACKMDSSGWHGNDCDTNNNGSLGQGQGQSQSGDDADASTTEPGTTQALLGCGATQAPYPATSDPYKHLDDAAAALFLHGDNLKTSQEQRGCDGLVCENMHRKMNPAVVANLKARKGTIAASENQDDFHSSPHNAFQSQASCSKLHDDNVFTCEHGPHRGLNAGSKSVGECHPSSVR
ncbi:protein polyglycylase TTLL10-like isoform X4 [Elysia marginata]|uniref:Protein polyglycylase TTLL10-like isoform X4 n=1 Tax=Elysia marginata TaxID=1093978 RepID=A0AAV4FZ40_9GAST|nr:protein polyglycylase TTLL10-like isoform X4 [Elysia marginata]